MRDTMVGFLHSNDVSSSWHKSMFDLYAYDAGTQHFIAEQCSIKTGGLFIPRARNDAARSLLESECDWLFFIDTDMGFKPDVLERLRAVADPVHAPIVGGLCFAVREVIEDGYNGQTTAPTPTIFDWVEHDDGIKRMTGRSHYPPNTLLPCAGTGTACVLIHRSVLQAMRDEYGETWFDQIRDEAGDLMGEDISFCARAGAVGAPIWVHTGIRTTHNKATWVGEREFWTGIIVPQAKTEVDIIVPVMDRPHNAEPFMASLRATTALATVTAVSHRGDEATAAAWSNAGANVIVQDKDRPTTFAAKVNDGYRATTNPLIFLAGDDVRFHPGWLDHAEFMCTAYEASVIGTNDGANPRVIQAEHATHMLIVREYVDKYGASWDGPGVLAHEGYGHWYVDDEIVTVAKQRNTFTVALGSMVEHLHPLWGTADHDHVYELGQSKAADDAELWRRRFAEHGSPSPRPADTVPRFDRPGDGPIQGRVASGFGSASRDFENGAYDSVDFGFDPYPGTLNVHCDDMPSINPTLSDYSLTVAGQRLWLTPGELDGEPVWLQFGENRPLWQVEVIAAKRLRDTYRDGETVCLTLT